METLVVKAAPLQKVGDPTKVRALSGTTCGEFPTISVPNPGQVNQNLQVWLQFQKASGAMLLYTLSAVENHSCLGHPKMEL